MTDVGEKSVHFAGRTAWETEENAISAVCGELRSQGVSFADLTVSNPTRCAIPYPEAEITAALSSADNFCYKPDPWGLMRARETIASMYREHGVAVSAERVMLTSSTSEAYNYVLRLLCDPGDEVLAPAPSYPLFQFLADVNDVRMVEYPLVRDCGWRLDRAALEQALTERCRAIIVVNPNNPTGSYLHASDVDYLCSLALERGLALICDEVFSDYVLEPMPDARMTLLGRAGGPLTFVLNGFSKMLALPQLKLSWLVVQGGGALSAEASKRLEMIADTFLSVNTPVQNAVPVLLGLRQIVQERVMERLRSNLAYLRGVVADVPGLELYDCEGGWYAVVRISGVDDEERFCLNLLRRRQVLVHPGYYYDFLHGAHVVLSLLTEPALWRRGLAALTEEYVKALA